MSLAYKTEIAKLLSSLGMKAVEKNPDMKNNTGRAIGEAYFWDEVQALAKAKSDEAWERLETMGMVVEDDPEPGDYDIGSSPHFAVTCKVSKPRKKFDEQAAAKAINKKWKDVPIPAVRQIFEQSKLPSTKTKTYNISEK
jgi:hypothetical protein